MDRAGEVYIPVSQVGPVHVAGLPYSQLTDRLRQAVGRVYRNFDLLVDVGRVRAIQVYVSGQAEKGKDWNRQSQLGCTKEGVPFVRGEGPKCIVTGGTGTIPVTYAGKTYYVCCTGCRDAFKENPEKYLKEFAERKAKEKEKGQ